MPLVSVIIPAHNSAATLPETLASVRSQTWRDYEIVAVDDGSTDATYTVLHEAGPGVTALRNEQAGGPAAARNRALRHASGELVAFLDADDLLEPRYLESQIACLNAARLAGRRVGLVACDAYLLDDGVRAAETYRDIVRDQDEPFTLDLVLARNPIYISSLVPAEAGRSVGWFDEELFGTEDFGLWLKLLEAGYEAVRNPEVLATYRRRAGTVSSNIASQGINNRRVYELALARGRLNRRQRAISRRALRYNRAMEAVARVRFAPDRRRAALDALALAPVLAWVAVTNPRWWGQWVAVLRTGRVPAAAVKPTDRSGA